MRKMTLTLMAGILMLSLLATSAAAAEGQKGEWELGAYAGYGWLDDYDVLHPKNDLLYGLRVGYFLTPRFSLECSYQRLSTDTDLDSGLGIPNEEFDLTSVRLNLLWNFR